jgi:hypothetical protein
MHARRMNGGERHARITLLALLLCASAEACGGRSAGQGATYTCAVQGKVNALDDRCRVTLELAEPELKDSIPVHAVLQTSEQGAFRFERQLSTSRVGETSLRHRIAVRCQGQQTVFGPSFVFAPANGGCPVVQLGEIQGPVQTKGERVR